MDNIVLEKNLPVIESIIEQHAEEAAFLWLQRDAAVCTPHYSLKDLAHLDDRVEAHLDGLRIAGDCGWKICEKALELEEVGEVFAAAVLAFKKCDWEKIDIVISAGSKSPETFQGLVSAMGWLANERLSEILPYLLKANSRDYRRLGIAASTIHRNDPGNALNDALENSDLFLKARSLRAVGELKRRDLLPVLRKHFQSEDETCRFWSAWSALMLSDKSAIDPIKVFVTSGSVFRERALQIVLRVMDGASAQSWLKGLVGQEEFLRYVLIGTGIIGDPVYIPTLINQMGNPEVARVAGEAFSMITGVDLAYDDLQGEWPEGFEAGPTEEPEDENVEMDPDEDLPWPEPVLIQKWWDENKNSFQIGRRYLVGKPVSEEQCQLVLKTGMQRQRVAAAMELALIQINTPLFETRAPGLKQQRLLGVK